MKIIKDETFFKRLDCEQCFYYCIQECDGGVICSNFILSKECVECIHYKDRKCELKMENFVYCDFNESK